MAFVSGLDTSNIYFYGHKNIKYVRLPSKMNKCSGNIHRLVGTDQNQVGIVIINEMILEWPTLQASGRAEGKGGRPEPDTPEHQWSNVKPLLD